MKWEGLGKGLKILCNLRWMVRLGCDHRQAVFSQSDNLMTVTREERSCWPGAKPVYLAIVSTRSPTVEHPSIAVMLKCRIGTLSPEPGSVA